ncbi:hypothetical protein Tco_0285740 [Tanacetum coccineum]
MNNTKHIVNLEYFREMLQICPKLLDQQFKEPPFEEEILTFLRDFGHSREIKVITDVNVNKLHQPWRSFAAIINKWLSGTDKGTGGKPRVPNVLTYGSDDEQISWKSSDEENDNEVGMSDDDDDNDDDDDDDADNQDDDCQDDDGQEYDGQDDEDQDDDNEQTDSDNDGDDFVHPKFSTLDQEEGQDDKDNEEEGSYMRVQTPSHYESTDDEEKDTHVIMIAVAPEVQQQSSSVSSGFISNTFNPNLDTCIDSILNLNTESTSLVDVPVSTVVEMPPSFATTIPPPPIKDRVKALEDDFSKFKQTNQFIAAVSSIPVIIDTYLANKMNEAIKIAIQLPSDRLRDEAQAKNANFINKLNDNIKKIIKEQVKAQVKEQVTKILPRIEKTINEQLEAKILTCSSNEAKISHAVAANLSEVELKKILIDKMENPVTIKRSRDDQDEDESAGSNRGSKRRRAGKEPESTSAPKEKISKSSSKSKEGSKSHHTSTGKPAHVEEPIHADKDLEELAHQEFDIGFSEDQPKEDTHDSFNDLMDTPLDFSAFVINRLKADTLTLELLAGPTFELMKGSCKSLVELEYFLEEVCKATTNKLDWNNPEGQQYPHDLRKPLPLIPNSQGRRVIPFDHFINNDLAYLMGGSSSRTYATSVTKTKAADYGLGISHWGRKHQQFYGFAINIESAHDVYSKSRIIAITKLQIVESHNYKHLDWIKVRRNDDKLYTFKERDYKRLRLQDIKDMLLLLVQDKLTNLTIEECLALNVSL